MSINIFICHFIFDALDRVSLFVNVGYLMVLMLSPAALKVGADPRQISDQLLSLSDLHLNTANTRIVRFVWRVSLSAELGVLDLVRISIQFELEILDDNHQLPVKERFAADRAIQAEQSD